MYDQSDQDKDQGIAPVAFSAIEKGRRGKRVPWAFVPCVLALTALTGLVWLRSASASGAHHIEAVSILERGIYKSFTGGPPVAQGSLGPVSNVQQVSLLRNTMVIPARKSLKFGVRYRLDGPPAGSSVELKLVTRFPEAGLLDPTNDVRHHMNEYTIRGVAGVSAYREFQFDKDWELVHGKWVFEFWRAGKKVGSQEFCVIHVAAETFVPDALDSECRYELSTTGS